MILFVCTGNTCRSPLAAALARAHGLDAESAGLMAAEGRPASEGSMDAALKRGIDLSSHRSRQISAGLIAEAEAVYAMTEPQAAYLRQLFPEEAAKIRALVPEIPDPYGGDEAVYERCARKIEGALRQCGLLP